ncbi:MAG TPA: hypothetical protein VJK52_03770, partial [Candidatus Nanoarchaeia archaeon]|nr:hypothetical protein [Candidatus Nanoarchaeia archaeon]
TNSAEAVPKWLQIRFGQLWEKYGNHASFSLANATEVLDESKEVVTVILSRLRKSGWVTVTFDESDFRKRNYRLKNPAEIFSRLTPEMTTHA